MKSLICAASMLCLVAVVGLISQTAGAADGETATIEKIMDALHKGRKSPMGTLKTALKSASPNWAVVQKEAKTYAKFAADLPKNDPPKGDAESFKKLARTFATNAKDLETAATKEDLDAAKAAFKKIGGSCMGCHRAHKED